MIDALGAPQSLLVLGGSSDIGIATAEAFARRRALRVVLAGRPSERLDAAADRLRQLGATVQLVDFDARRPEDHAAVVADAAKEGDIDIALVTFGLLGNQERAWTDVNTAVELAETNYVGSVSVGVALANQFRRQKHGLIVVLSSVAGERPRRSNFVYGSTKAGMDAFYTGLGEALRSHGVRVVVVRPGFVHSNMTSGMKPGPLSVTPQQVAQAIVDAVKSRAETIWVPPPLRLVMAGLRHVPRPLFRRLPI